MRWQALRVWNHSLGVPSRSSSSNNNDVVIPNEGLSGGELARLLCFVDSNSALEFAGARGGGLPVEEPADRVVRFKVHSMAAYNSSRAAGRSLRQDAIVLSGDVLRQSSDDIALPSIEWLRQVLLDR